MKHVLVMVAIAFIATTPANSYPISPRPLRKLIIESEYISEYIIIGHVRAIKDAPGKKEYDPFDGSRIAVIDVIEVLQGKTIPTTLELGFEPNMICPAPPSYFENTDVIVFLNKHKHSFRTHALSYGAKTMPMNDITVYRTRIKEMQQILTISDKDEQFIQSIEWLVKCAEVPATRHEGTYELAPEGDFMSYYDRTEGQPFRQMLSAGQRDRLRSALLADPSAVDFSLVDLVYPENESAVFNLLVAGLKELPSERMWVADSYMDRIMLHKRTPKLEAVYKEFREVEFSDRKNHEKKQVALLKEFVDEIERP
jgi:hypothetical protein